MFDITSYLLGYIFGLIGGFYMAKALMERRKND